jgi:hypothetical protein
MNRKENKSDLVKEFIKNVSNKEAKEMLKICINRLIESEDLNAYRDEENNGRVKVYDVNSGDDIDMRGDNK